MAKQRGVWLYGVFVLIFFCGAPCAAKWWKQATFYELFVRSYQDSNGDGIGDLQGVISRLDYLQELGVKGIWLMPVFPSPTYHGYDATDYQAIEPDLGTLEDFRQLVQEAHQRDIRIILDIAVNHTSDRHPWFTRQHDWYVWRSAAPAWGNWYLKGSEYYYSVFDRSMPNLNWRNPKVPEAVKALLRFWMKQGVDGFRLDAARYYVPGPAGEPDTLETHAAIEDFAEAMRREFPEVLFVGEIWTDSKTIYSYCTSGKELDLAFNFPLAFGLVPTLNTEDPASFLHALHEYRNVFQKAFSSAPFLSNHDMVRIASELWDYTPKIKLAAEVYFMLPGTPFVYYGEELGFPNGPGQGDLPKRLPMQWANQPGFGFTPETSTPWAPFLGKGELYNVQSQQGEPGSLLELYRRLIHFRNGSPLIALGDIDKIYSPGKNLILWKRRYGAQNAVVVVNFSYKPSQSFQLDASVGPFSQITETLYGDVLLAGPPHIPSLPPHSVHVFRVE